MGGNSKALFSRSEKRREGSMGEKGFKVGYEPTLAGPVV